MTLHLSLPGAHRSNQQQEELREARRVLKERIRTDWDYPTLPAWRSSGGAAEREEERKAVRTRDVDEEDKIAGFRFHAPSSAASMNSRGHVLGLDFDPTEWREREEASETEGEGNSVASPTNNTGSTSKRKSKDSSAYQFEGPDSVATQLMERRIARKRKRNEALQEEMQWNKGLELWIHRRDQWSCARLATDVHLAERERSNEQAMVAESSSTSSTPRSSTSSTSTPATTPSTTPDSIPATTTTIPSLLPPDLLIPVAPSLLPNHPIRRRISTSMYPEIYSKIILQSRTPSIPINLSTLVKALVQGWKDDGEWPPKAGPLEPSMGRKKISEGGIRHGIKKVLRVTGVVDSGRKDVGRKDGEG